MLKFLFTFFMILFFLGGCVGFHPAPSPEQINSADYGPSPGSWDELVRKALASELVRPDSLYVRQMEPPVKSWIVTPDGETIFGWGICGFMVSGISRMQPFFVMIRDDRVIYEHLGFDLAKRIPGRTWTLAGTNPYKAACPNLFK